MAKLRHEGKTASFTATAAQVVGDMVQLRANGEKVGIVMQDMAIGDVADVSIEGVYEITKSLAADTGLTGKAVSISTVGQTVDCTPSANAVHTLAKDTANGDTVAWVKINHA